MSKVININDKRETVKVRCTSCGETLDWPAGVASLVVPTDPNADCLHEHLISESTLRVLDRLDKLTSR
jgi:hypothetical protein